MDSAPGLRRELIVVSNRGPVTFARDADGNRIARRGGGGLVTALRSLVSHHDVTWVASAISDEDRAVAAEAGSEALGETAADGARFDPKLFEGVDDATFVNVLANAIAFPVEEKQALLEADGVPERYARLASALSFRRAELEQGARGARGALH